MPAVVMAVAGDVQQHNEKTPDGLSGSGQVGEN
jgi:hypothetical protein